MKINIDIIIKSLVRHQEEIKKADEYTIPEIIADMQGTEAMHNLDDDHRNITEISVYTIETVLPCWTTTDEGQNWIDEMIEQQKQSS